MKEPSKEQIKERAKFLREVLREKHKIDLPHGHALEVLARVFGYKDWNTASALSANAPVPSKENLTANTEQEKPIAAKLQTAGELVDFFANFDRDTNVVVNEYKETVPDVKDPNSISDFLKGTMTSVCSLTYDYEIQNGKELRLELNTETERHSQLQDFGKSAKQTFERTPAGRLQRRIKYLYIQHRSLWNYKGISKTDS